MANANGPLEDTLLEGAETELRDQIERARTRIEELDGQLRRAVQERPLIAVASAVLLGYALGRLLARR